MKFTKHEAFPFALFVVILLASAVILDAIPNDDDSITGQASWKSLRKKIKKELQQAIGQAPKPAPTPPPQQAVSPTPTGQCLDSDGGWNVLQAGKVSMGQVICTDRCATPEELQRSQGKDKLFECFCGNKQASGGGQGSGWTDCQYECKDGACLAQPAMQLKPIDKKPESKYAGLTPKPASTISLPQGVGV